MSGVRQLRRRTRRNLTRLAALGTVVAAFVSLAPHPADAKIVKKDRVGATDPTLGCSDPWKVAEVQSFANLDATISGNVFLDLNNKVFYNEYTAQFRDALTTHFNRKPTCTQLQAIMNNKPTAAESLQYVACSPGAASRPNRFCGMYDPAQRASYPGNAMAVSYVQIFLNECSPVGLPGRYVGFQQLNVVIGRETIIPILWSATVKFRDVNIYQGLKTDDDNAASQGRVLRANHVESFLTMVQSALVPRFPGAAGNGLTMASVINNARDGKLDATISYGGQPISSWIRGYRTLLCALAPSVQRVVDPNGHATKFAFNQSFRNLFDRLYNKSEGSKNVKIGTDVVCNPPGEPRGSGFCENLYVAFDGVAALGTAPGSLGWNCVKRNIGSLLSGDKPDFRNC